MELSSPRARAVTGRRCPNSGVGEDFLARPPVSRKRKVEKSIQRLQMDRLAKGYKRAIVEIQCPIAKKRIFGPKSEFLGPIKKGHFLVETMFRPRLGKVVQRKKYPFPKLITVNELILGIFVEKTAFWQNINTALSP